MKLSKTKIKQVEAWLGSGNKEGHCPFDDETGCGCGDLKSNICKKAFPKIKPIGIFGDDYYTCPCKEYSLNHVIKKAKQMVKTGEV